MINMQSILTKEQKEELNQEAYKHAQAASKHLDDTFVKLVDTISTRVRDMITEQ